MDPATGSLRAALIVSDMFLMPVLPRSFDIWAVEHVGDREAREALNPGLRACIFLNSAELRAVRPGNGTTFALANETSHRQLARGRDLHPAAGASRPRVGPMLGFKRFLNARRVLGGI